jgi:hypothetical protein
MHNPLFADLQGARQFKTEERTLFLKDRVGQAKDAWASAARLAANNREGNVTIHIYNFRDLLF